MRLRHPLKDLVNQLPRLSARAVIRVLSTSVMEDPVRAIRAATVKAAIKASVKAVSVRAISGPVRATRAAIVRVATRASARVISGPVTVHLVREASDVMAQAAVIRASARGTDPMAAVPPMIRTASLSSAAEEMTEVLVPTGATRVLSYPRLLLLQVPLRRRFSPAVKEDPSSQLRSLRLRRRSRRRKLSALFPEVPTRVPILSAR